MGFMDQEFNLGGGMPPKGYNELLEKQIEEEKKVQAWLLKRLGKITASCFSELMTNPTGEDKKIGLSSGAQSYVLKRVWEKLTEKRHDEQFSTNATDHGNLYEKQAIEEYMSRMKIEVHHYGSDQKFFEYGDNCGGTPDGVTFDIFNSVEGGQEVKCPFTGYNVLKLASCLSPAALKKVEKKYYWQVIGQMLITGANWWDFIVFDPRIGNGLLHVLRFNRSEVQEDIKLLKNKLEIAEQFLMDKVYEFAA